MASYLFRASSSDVWAKCPLSAVLSRLCKQETNRAMRKGTMLHRSAMEICLKVLGYSTNVFNGSSIKIHIGDLECALRDLDGVIDPAERAVAGALNALCSFLSARYKDPTIVLYIDLEKSLYHESIPLSGTPDFVAYNNDFSLILDYKFGEVKVNENTLQIDTYAHLFHEGFKEFGNYVGIIQENDNFSGAFTREARDITPYLDRIELLKNEVSNGLIPKFNTGKHCVRCNGKNICPSRLNTEINMATLMDLLPDTMNNKELMELVKESEALIKYANGVKDEILRRYETMEISPVDMDKEGIAVESKQSNRKIDEKKLLKMVSGMEGIKSSDLYETKKSLKTIGRMRKILDRVGIDLDSVIEERDIRNKIKLKHLM